MLSLQSSLRSVYWLTLHLSCTSPQPINLAPRSGKNQSHHTPGVCRGRQQIRIPRLLFELVFTDHSRLAESSKDTVVEAVQLLFTHGKSLQIAGEHWARELQWIFVLYHCISKHYGKFKYVACLYLCSPTTADWQSRARTQ